ncbi:MAG: hypothetical protein PUP46_10105 [Endozoicomonas sp. (ex Botrylloides leachii)]|nr:hypothetical protein [Endozoicomonas sp. (ex Botrylloides leachii)]
MLIRNGINSFSKVKDLSSEDKAALLLWLAVAIGLVIDSLYFPGGSVVFNYLDGANRWLDNTSLYAGPEGYLYLPQFAMLFSFLPAHLAYTETVWNLIQLIVLVSSLFFFSRIVAKPNEKSFFLILSVVMLIISFTTFRNGQATIIQVGIMLWTVITIINKQWGVTAFLLIAGLIAKPVFLIFFLLVAFFYFKLWWRVLIGFAFAFCIPVLLKGYDYTLEQHIGFITMLQQALSFGESGYKTNWAHFFAIFPQVFDFWVPSSIQLVSRIVIGIVLLYALYFSRKHHSITMAGYYLYAFSACYLLLFNPRTETNSFALIAPAIGYWLAVFTYRCPNIKHQLFIGALVLSFPFAKYVQLITPGMWAWGKTVITLVFCIFLIKELTKKSTNSLITS